jgi:hypothetical protein
MGIFQTLLKDLGSPEFAKLREPQSDVLEQYERHLGSLPTDVAIEMPAGTGKTLVALLIGELHRRKGKKVAMLEGTRQLAKQTFDEAQALGVPAAHFSGKKRDWAKAELLAWQKSERMAILNYWGYMNSSPGLSPADVLILDDAHLAEYRLLDLFSARIPRGQAPELFDRIVGLIHDLRPGRYPFVEDLISQREDASDALLLPFHDLFAIHDPLMGLLRGATIESVSYSWSAIGERLHSMALYLTAYEILIRPIVAPALDWKHFAAAAHRIYLSATIGDVDDFSRRLGCHVPLVLSPRVAVPRQSGRRLIVLFPSREDGEEKLRTVIDGLRHLWPVGRRRLWMCSSWRDVEEWEERLPRAKDGSRVNCWRLEGAGDDVLPLFTSTQPAHLFTAARYDGMDFPGDDCRLAIMTTPPVCCDAQEAFFSAHLRDARLLKSRFSQRVAQALGRCNRGPADFAVYVLLDPRFERTFGGNDPDYLELLPRDIAREIEYALRLCDRGFVQGCKAAADFLSGDFADWEENVGRLSPSAPQQKHIDFRRSPEVEAFLSLWRGDTVGASERLGKLLDREPGSADGYRAFLRYCKAWTHYLRGTLLGEKGQIGHALQEMEQAARIGTSCWFTRFLRASVVDIQNEAPTTSVHKPNTAGIPDYRTVLFDSWDKALFDRGLKPAVMTAWLQELQEMLKSNSHDNVVRGLRQLAALLGFSPMPCRREGAPDSLWRYEGEPRHVVTWEAKVEVLRSGISIADVNQAHGQGRWATEQFSAEGFAVFSLIAANMAQIDHEARQRLDHVRCVSISLIQRLAGRVVALFETYRAAWLPNDPSARRRARTLVENSIPSADWLKSAVEASSKSGFLFESDVLSKWGASG